MHKLQFESIIYFPKGYLVSALGERAHILLGIGAFYLISGFQIAGGCCKLVRIGHIFFFETSLFLPFHTFRGRLDQRKTTGKVDENKMEERKMI